MYHRLPFCLCDGGWFSWLLFFTWVENDDEHSSPPLPLLGIVLWDDSPLEGRVSCAGWGWGGGGVTSSVMAHCTSSYVVFST